MRFGIVDHALDLVVRQAGTGLDLDLLLLAGLLVLGGHVDDALGVDVERHLHLRHAARRGVDAGEVELGQRLVVAGLLDRKSTRLNSDHYFASRKPSSSWN